MPVSFKYNRSVIGSSADAASKEMIVYGNIVYTIGSILVAAATTVRSFNFMIGGRVILAVGDIATQIAQYKMFSSWFAPSNGFASTLGFELAIGKVWSYVGEVECRATGLISDKIGGFVGKSTANVIAKVGWLACTCNSIS